MQGWARDGLTDEQICHKIGIHVATLCDWKNRFPQLDEALKKGKAPVDQEVENALLRNAMGYDYEEKVTEIEELPGGKQRKHERIIRKHKPPDTTAQIFWLKNRRPDRWRDKQDVALNAEPVRIVIDV